MLQAGPSAAALCAAGTYSGPLNTNLTLSSNVTLRGAEGAALPTIDCGGSGRALTVASSATLKGGALPPRQPSVCQPCCNASGVGAAWLHAGSTCPRLHVFAVPTAAWTPVTSPAGLRFLNGSVGQDSGGCILITGGAPTVDSCQFEGCRADLGGAINVAAARATATVVGSRFAGCSARRGGGVRVAAGAAVSVAGCSFEGNAADDAVGVGGAMVFDGSAPCSIRDTNMTGGELSPLQREAFPV